MLHRPLWLLALALPLAGCLQDGSPPAPDLQAVETRDASDSLTGLTLLDRDAEGALVRVRHYRGPGADGVWRTADDELQSWSRCQVEEAGAPLRDPMLELSDQPWLGGRFLVRSCAIEERASRIQEQAFDHPGLDGIWFTADDQDRGTLLLARTSTGHRRTFTPPPPALCTPSCDGLDNIVYDPYAGLERVTTATYGQDGSSRLLQMPYATFRYDFDTQGRLLRKTSADVTGALTESGNVVLDLFQLGMTQTYTDFDYHEDGTVLARQVALYDSDVFASIQASPTGQILLAVLGYTDSPVEIGGESFYAVTTDRFRLVLAAGRLQQLALLSGPGADAQWGTADDEVYNRLVYRYDTP